MLFPVTLRQVQVVWAGSRVRRLTFVTAPPLPASSAAATKLATLLARYFAGDVVDFSVVPLALEGSAFQRRVWQAIQAIPYGEVRSYAELAAQIGQPRAARAVGNAAAANPTVILIPCHRVVRSDGFAGNYGGGARRKRLLLTLEEGDAVSSDGQCR